MAEEPAAPAAEPVAAPSTEAPAAEPPPEGAPAAETPATDTPPAAAKPEKTAGAFAALARRERELRKAEEAIAAQRQKIEWAEKVSAGLREKPLETLGALGLTLDGLAQHAVPKDDATLVKERLEQLEQETKAEREARIVAERDAQIAQGKRYVATEVEKLADKYPLTHEMGRADEVFELMAIMYRDHNTELSVEEAAAEVEKALVDEEKAVERAQQRRAKAKGTGAPGAQTSSDQNRGPQTAPTPTISSRLNGEAASNGARPYDPARHTREVREKFLRGELT